MEYFEQLAFDFAQHNSSLWLCYIDDTFVVWPHGLEHIENFFRYLGSLRLSIQFTMEIESDSTVPFMGVLVIRNGHQSLHKTHLQFANVSLSSNHLPHVKSGLIQGLHERASTICKEQQIYMMKLLT
jgi:hypothetical protein